MSSRELPEDLLRAVSPLDLRSYASAMGWRRRPAPGPFAVFEHPGSELDQLLAPQDPNAPGYERRIAEALEVLAEREGRPATEVLHDVLQADSDVVRFRVSSPDASRGALPLEEGIDLLEGAKQALLSAACSVIAPRRYHPRLSRAEAEQMLAGCRLGQTERGSFTVAISCPLHAVEPAEPTLDLEAPFVRRATRLLMGSAVRIVSAIEKDAVDDLYASSLQQPPLSANFCDALLQMQPPQERGCLTLSCTWASALPMTGSVSMPRAVTFRREHFTVVEQIYQRLRPAEE